MIDRGLRGQQQQHQKQANEQMIDPLQLGRTASGDRRGGRQSKTAAGAM